MAKINPITKISSCLIRVLGCNPGPMTLQGTNTYLIGTGLNRLLLDTGDPNVPEYIDYLRQVIREERIQIKDIIISHWHHDHVGGVDDVLQAIENRDICKIWKFRRSDAPDPRLENGDFCELKHGQRFTIDGATLEVIHTPGHTTDHIILFLHENNAVFSGDCILGEGTTVFEDLYDYMKSLQIIQDIKPNVIYPGHGNIIMDAKERITQYINHRNQRESQILSVLMQNPSIVFNEMDIVKKVYKDTPKNLWSAASYNVQHHLNKLTKENKVAVVPNGWTISTNA